MEMNERRSTTCFQCQFYPGRARRVARVRRPPPPPPIEEDYGDQGLLRVVAMYDFIPNEDTGLTLHEGEEYSILHKQTPQWWRAQDRMGNRGFIPSNYVKEKTSIEANPWYCNISRTEAEDLLRQEDKEGGFVVRTSSQQGVYTVSVYSKSERLSCIRHYQIKHTESGQFFLAEKHTFGSIPEVITYHQHNAAGLVTRLRYPIGPMKKCVPATSGFCSGGQELFGGPPAACEGQRLRHDQVCSSTGSRPGVVMWEVYSEGQVPFQHDSNQEVVEKISSGVRLYRPHRATAHIYHTMYHCWHETPQGRPSFSELLEQLNKLAEQTA
ncbi:Tyrosine-protein kinase TXK [Merluccius polli]|uniref:Tyrosine-protein kinase n=1 Tax=Merluccius polli TaxID=89951 RepID=A0AA47N683_MERPO|nr:Tyrosine-protein kinase TXK [Merluccius polli]